MISKPLKMPGPLPVELITRLSVELLGTHENIYDAARRLNIHVLSQRDIAEQLADDCGVVWCSVHGWCDLVDEDDKYDFEQDHGRDSWKVEMQERYD